MNNQPLVTVLMPCYNALPYLQEALDSIINQTYKNLEILCINDGSTDKTGEILNEYAQKDTRIKIITNETNLKLIRTLNKGIELANGEYIARMDADDIATENRIQVQIDYFQQHPEIDVVSCASFNITEDGTPISKNIPRNKSAKGSLFASFFFVPIGHPEVTFKANVLKDNHFLFDNKALHTEDYELWSRLVRKGYHLTNIDDYLLNYRINSQSISRKYTDIQDENFISCAQQHYFAYFGKTISREIIQILVNRIDINSFTKRNFNDALNQMKKLKKEFIQKESIVDKTTLKEIQSIYSTHLFDILFQAFKNSKGKLKLYMLYKFLIYTPTLLNKSVYKYILSKKITSVR